ncbi:hypothetical protein G7077_00125 [Sphingomonas piscis]|uniref:Uncharacterized protein n=1 Tax=Sphingomonas piscis TaxID=2714943 RepID=A0A6G7YLE2_9SPHN|nr:hypothetical protein [Sphingomonas piscis]QIK77563.1 hypothetical protein G7077_00125 [Sphingomonas piscis]
MLAVLSTLVCVATLWMIGAVALRMAEESGGKVLAALRGQSGLAEPTFTAVPVRVRSRAVVQQRPVRVTPKQRAVA